MMNTRGRIATGLSLVLALVLGIGIGSYAAGGYGSASDPLITLSYLEDKLTPEILEQVEDMLDERQNDMVKEFNKLLSGQGAVSSDGYSVVTLNNGQTIVGEVGCEVMLRIGSAVCSAQYSPGLIDTSAGSSINNGAALTANHMYMVTIAGNGVTATASGVKVLVRGGYTIK